jgi:phage recombination protein Bet
LERAPGEFQEADVIDVEGESDGYRDQAEGGQEVTAGTAVALLPTDGDSAHWTAQERALVEAAGLTRVTNRDQGTKALADRPTVEAFLAHCRRTGLDPIARQIYAIYRGGKWGIQISIDGARLVAERTGQYEGQTTPEFTSDGTNWTQVWLADEAPKAARVGVFRRGFREPLYAVALWEAYAVYDDVWESGRKTGEKRISSMWKKMGPLMLAKCAEMLALRKAFPQDLSGLYSSEEMAQAAPPASAPVAVAQAVASRPETPREEPAQLIDWVKLAKECQSLDELTKLANEADDAGQLGLVVEGTATVMDKLRARKSELEGAGQPALVDVPKQRSAKRLWVREARAMKTRVQVQELYQEAIAAGAPAQVLEELEAIERTLPEESADEPSESSGWAVAEIPESEWVEGPDGEFHERSAVMDDSIGGDQVE